MFCTCVCKREVGCDGVHRASDFLFIDFKFNVGIHHEAVVTSIVTLLFAVAVVVVARVAYILVVIILNATGSKGAGVFDSPCCHFVSSNDAKVLDCLGVVFVSVLPVDAVDGRLDVVGGGHRNGSLLFAVHTHFVRAVVAALLGLGVLGVAITVLEVGEATRNHVEVVDVVVVGTVAAHLLFHLANAAKLIEAHAERKGHSGLTTSLCRALARRGASILVENHARVGDGSDTVTVKTIRRS